MDFKKKFLSAAVTMLIAAGMSLPAMANCDFDSTQNGSYSWNSNGETKVTGTDDLVTDGQLQIGISNSTNDYRYGDNLVWWNGTNENASNNRKLIFKPKYNGTVTLKAGCMSNAKKLSANLMIINDENYIIKVENLTNASYSNPVEMEFSVTAGRVYTIYPEGGNPSWTGAYISDFVFLAPSKAVTYCATPEILTDDSVSNERAYYGELTSAGEDAENVGFIIHGTATGGGEVTGKILFNASDVAKNDNKFGAVIKNCTGGIEYKEVEYYTGE